MRTLEIPEPRGFTLRDALIGAVVAAALIELAPGMESDRAYLSAGVREPSVKPAHLLPCPKPNLP